jgi:hypothetical protein
VSVPLSTQQFAEKPNRYMPRTRVRLDKVVATQNYLDPAKVRDIARQDPSDMTSDPIAHSFQGRYYVGDGHHRVGGAIERGDTHIWIKRSK